ncbi:bcl-2-related protein A1, partial [Nannospalax galili]|uniref:bcl-2-related protein A1 n=1 Tax=Nannospalax galili TaxID=1026970 RepID=UPI00111C0657
HIRVSRAVFPEQLKKPLVPSNVLCTKVTRRQDIIARCKQKLKQHLHMICSSPPSPELPQEQMDLDVDTYKQVSCFVAEFIKNNTGEWIRQNGGWFSGTMAQGCNTRAWEVEEGVSEFQGCPRLPANWVSTDF